MNALTQPRDYATCVPTPMADTPECGSRGGECWFVIRTVGRQENRALVSVSALGFRTYLPLIVEHAPRRPARIMPLFYGYLFARFDPWRDQWGAIRAVPGVAGILSTRGDPGRKGSTRREELPTEPPRPIPVPECVVESLMARGRAGDGVIDDAAVPFADPFPVGELARVLDGPFTSFEGICTWSSGERVKLLLDIFGRAAETEMARSAVESV